MKLVFYSLAAVLLVGLGSIVQYSRAQVDEKPVRQTCERVVYVNEDSLARLHPAWRALNEMEAILAEVNATSGGVLPQVGVKRPNLARVAEVKPHVDRRELESEARDDAVSALVQQEQEMRRALWLRAQSARENMLARADMELVPNVHEIEASAAAMLKALDEKYAPDDVNARIKAGALRVIAKSPAVDAKSAESRLKLAEGEVAQVENARDADKQRVVDVANARIAKMREAEIDRVDRWMDDYETSENKRIEGDVLAAKDRLCRDLGLNDYSLRLRKARSAPEAHSVALRPGSTAPDTGGVAELRSTIAALRKQIALDVERAISKSGRQKGVIVSLGRNHAGLPDETKQFAAMMQDGEWSKTGPVLCLARGQ